MGPVYPVCRNSYHWKKYFNIFYRTWTTVKSFFCCHTNCVFFSLDDIQITKATCTHCTYFVTHIYHYSGTTISLIYVIFNSRVTWVWASKKCQNHWNRSKEPTSATLLLTGSSARKNFFVQRAILHCLQKFCQCIHQKMLSKYTSSKIKMAIVWYMILIQKRSGAKCPFLKFTHKLIYRSNNPMEFFL